MASNHRTYIRIPFLLLALLLAAVPALAATYDITSYADLLAYAGGALAAQGGQSPQDGDVLNITQSFAMSPTDTTATITLTGDITINGGDNTITGNGAAQILAVDTNGGTASIGNLRLTNGGGDNAVTTDANGYSRGGALFVDGDADLDHCTLDDNTADTGGALYVTGDLTLTGSLLADNTATATTSPAAAAARTSGATPPSPAASSAATPPMAAMA